MWFDLKGDERISERCATDGCCGQPTSRLETDGVASVYCSGCRAKIEKPNFLLLSDEELRRFDKALIDSTEHLYDLKI